MMPNTPVSGVNPRSVLKNARGAKAKLASASMLKIAPMVVATRLYKTYKRSFTSCMRGLAPSPKILLMFKLSIQQARLLIP